MRLPIWLGGAALRMYVLSIFTHSFSVVYGLVQTLLLLILLKQQRHRTDKRKPAERQRRKVNGSNAAKRGHDRQATENECS